MPIDYKQYPANWKTEIRPSVMARAGEVRDELGKITTEARCEGCGVINHSIGYRDAAGGFIPWAEIEEALERHGNDYFQHRLSNCLRPDGMAKKALTIVITIAHLDHDKSNEEVKPERLRAWCQRCHLNYDRERHMANARDNRAKRKLLQSLF